MIFIRHASFHPLFSATRSNSKIQKALLGRVVHLNICNAFRKQLLRSLLVKVSFAELKV